MILRLEDELREDAQAAVKSLQALGVYVAMLSGDERKAAEAVAQTLGIQERQGALSGALSCAMAMAMWPMPAARFTETYRNR